MSAQDHQAAGLRLDKWLWYARFFKSRSLATQLCGTGKLRLAGEAVKKAHQKVRPGDVLTFPQGHHIRVIKVLALAARRGPGQRSPGGSTRTWSRRCATTALPRGTPPPVARRDPGQRPPDQTRPPRA